MLVDDGIYYDLGVIILIDIRAVDALDPQLDGFEDQVFVFLFTRHPGVPEVLDSAVVLHQLLLDILDVEGLATSIPTTAGGVEEGEAVGALVVVHLTVFKGRSPPVPSIATYVLPNAELPRLHRHRFKNGIDDCFIGVHQVEAKLED